jgi:hypothetical protein
MNILIRRVVSSYAMVLLFGGGSKGDPVSLLKFFLYVSSGPSDPCLPIAYIRNGEVGSTIVTSRLVVVVVITSLSSPLG